VSPLRKFLNCVVLAALLCVPASAQVSPIPGVGVPAFMPAAAGCSQASTFLARTSGLDATHTTAYTTLICGLVSDGIWSLLDAVYIFTTAGQTTAGLNLVSSSYTVTVNGTTTFTVDNGWAGDGSTGYLNTHFQPGAAANFKQNAASYGVYVLTNRSAVGVNIYVTNEMAISNYDIGFRPFNASGTQYFICSSDAVGTATDTTSQGMYVVSRTASNAVAIYKNGASLGSNADVSAALSNADTYVFAANGGAPSNFSSDKLGSAFYGASLTTAQMTQISTRINTYMTTFGVNVY
jgi:hypothetical protein